MNRETRVGNLVKNVKRTAVALGLFALVRSGLTIPRILEDAKDTDESESTEAEVVSLTVVVIFLAVLLPVLGLVGATRLNECALMTYAVICIVSSIRIFVATIAFIAQTIKAQSKGTSKCERCYLFTYIFLIHLFG